MAKQDHQDDPSRSSAAIAERRERDRQTGSDRKGNRVATVADSRDGGGPRQPVEKQSFFEVYKPAQGRYTRIGTGIGAAVIVLGGAQYIYGQMDALPWSNEGWFFAVRVATPVFLIITLGLLSYWLVGVKRSTADFLIATEGEMKKVNWSTRREVLGSTKVVILAVAILSLILFIVDVAFMAFFIAIGVLKSNILHRIFSPEI